MVIKFTPKATRQIVGLLKFIDSQNTFGAGGRWLKKFEDHMDMYLQTAFSIKPCHSQKLARLELKCLLYKDWTIALKFVDDEAIVVTVLHRSKITD